MEGLLSVENINLVSRCPITRVRTGEISVLHLVFFNIVGLRSCEDGTLPYMRLSKIWVTTITRGVEKILAVK